MYFSEAKYDAIGTIPRERLKMMSLYSTPVLWVELVMSGRNRVAETEKQDCSQDLPIRDGLRTSLCRNTACTHSSLRTDVVVV